MGAAWGATAGESAVVATVASAGSPVAAYTTYVLGRTAFYSISYVGGMSAISGIVFGAALAVYILSHYDRRVKKVYALVAAVIAALTALADFTSTQIPVMQECRTDITGTQTCVTKYASDATALIAFAMSIILIILTLIEMSLEGMSSAWP